MKSDQLGANTSCLHSLPLPEAVKRIRDLGFHGITLLAFAGTRHGFGDLAGFWFRDLSHSERDRLKRLVSSFKRLAIHAPFFDLPLVSNDPKVEQLAMERMRESIEATAYLGGQVAIIHANRRPNYHLGEYWDSLVSAFRSLGDYAAERRVAVGLETGFPDGVEKFVDLIEAIGHPAVGATLDTGHMARYVERNLKGTPKGARQLNERLMEVVRQLGWMTIHCQLHDVVIPQWADHHAIGHGVIDFQPFLMELEAIGYEGMLEFELEERDGVGALVESKTRIETLMSRKVARPLL